MIRPNVRIVPTISSDTDNSSEYLSGTPGTPQFIRAMRYYNEKRNTLQFCNNKKPLQKYDSQESVSQKSVPSITQSEYEERIKRQNKCVKCCFSSCFMGFLVALGMAA